MGRNDLLIRTFLSDLCFVVKEAQVDAFRSQSATLCLVQSLVVALAYRLGEGK
ncbi:hypothetical protein ABKU01_15890 [Enterobacter cloacae]